MANYTITPADVLYLGGTPVQWGVAAAAIAAGEAVFINAAGTLDLADANGATTEHGQVAGIALASAAIGQPVPYAGAGANVRLSLVSLDVTAEPVFLSQTPGKLMPHTDVAVGTFGGIVHIIGFLYDSGLRNNIKLVFGKSDESFND